MRGGHRTAPRRRPRQQRWGWHRLAPGWAERVVEASPVRPGDLVLDLGAGTGAVTRALLDVGAHVRAVELHPARAAALRDRFGQRVTVIEVDLEELRLPRRPFRVVANPPWSLSSAVLRSLLGTDRLLSADLVLPDPVVGGLVARPPSARHARRYRLGRGAHLPRSAFRPPPRSGGRVLTVRR